MLFAAGNSQQWINRRLERSHARPHHEKRKHRHAIGWVQGKTQRPHRTRQESHDHHGLLAKTFDEKTGWNGHNSISNKKGEWQKSGSGQTYFEAADDIG